MKMKQKYCAQLLPLCAMTLALGWLAAVCEAAKSGGA